MPCSIITDVYSWSDRPAQQLQPCAVIADAGVIGHDLVFRDTWSGHEYTCRCRRACVATQDRHTCTHAHPSRLQCSCMTVLSQLGGLQSGWDWVVELYHAAYLRGPLRLGGGRGRQHCRPCMGYPPSCSASCTGPQAGPCSASPIHA